MCGRVEHTFNITKFRKESLVSSFSSKGFLVDRLSEGGVGFVIERNLAFQEWQGVFLGKKKLESETFKVHLRVTQGKTLLAGLSP